jgi:aminoglycoside/choline kinase family phosphotransferase
MTRPLPKTPDDITGGWLTSVLRNSGGLPSNASVSALARRPVGEGVGMLSEIEFLDLTIDGDAPEAPSTVVVKFPTQNEVNRGVAEHFNVYTREVRYFADMDPLSAAAGPKVHLADIEGDLDFVIVLEDLSDYRIGDQVVGATLEETGYAIDELAKLHASFWGKVDSSDYDWLPLAANSQNARNLHQGSGAGWDPTVNIFGDHIPQWMRDAKDAYLAAVPRLQKRLDQGPRTLVHGDFRMDNLFFGQAPEHHKMTFLDWQGPLRGRGMHDVAYLMSQSTQTDTRRLNEQALVQRYCDGLRAEGIDGYEFDEAFEDYRHGVLYAWVYATLIAGTLDAENERGNAWMTQMITRNIDAIEDLNCLSLL